MRKFDPIEPRPGRVEASNHRSRDRSRGVARHARSPLRVLHGPADLPGLAGGPGGLRMSHHPHRRTGRGDLGAARPDAGRGRRRDRQDHDDRPAGSCRWSPTRARAGKDPGHHFHQQGGGRVVRPDPGAARPPTSSRAGRSRFIPITDSRPNYCASSGPWSASRGIPR